jgi:putative endonuclease
MHTYYTYILASQSRVLYVGVTRSLAHRLYEHQHELTPGFTSRYKVQQLVYYEEHSDIQRAIHREKQFKRWPRAWKIDLIESFNPLWLDLSERFVSGE